MFLQLFRVVDLKNLTRHPNPPTLNFSEHSTKVVDLFLKVVFVVPTVNLIHVHQHWSTFRGKGYQECNTMHQRTYHIIASLHL